MAKNDAGFVDALKKYAHADNVQIPTVFKSLKDETDRALVVIVGSMIEDFLAQTLKACMRNPANHRERAELWGTQGLLGTFSAKIKMAYALSIIDGGLRDRLDILREMRNACAHSQMPIDFKTAVLVEACRHFLDAKYKPEFKIKNEADRKDVRHAFYGETLRLMTSISDLTLHKLQPNALAPLIGRSPQPSSHGGSPRPNEK